LYGSSNYVGRNNPRNGLKQIVNFVKQHSHPNIIVVAVPHRFDLALWSCVNREEYLAENLLICSMEQSLS
jgi:hypothetical protein